MAVSGGACQPHQTTMRHHPLLLSILAVLPACNDSFETEGCLAATEQSTSCPDVKSIDKRELFLPSVCGSDLEVVSVLGPGELRESAGPLPEPACCYPVVVVDHSSEDKCIVGRPYREGTTLRMAPVALHEPAAAAAEPEAAKHRALRARAWAIAGAGEHASVAAFNRLSLQLMSLGAPPHLLAAVQQAALDEVHHATACWDLAKQLGAEVQVEPFPFGAHVDAQVTLERLAAEGLREGCLAETLGALVAEAAAAMTPHTEVRTVLSKLAREEATHAVLSFQIVAWALKAGGHPVRQAALEAARAPWPTLDLDELALRTGVEVTALQRAVDRAHHQVLRPATRALLS